MFNLKRGVSKRNLLKPLEVISMAQFGQCSPPTCHTGMLFLRFLGLRYPNSISF